MNSLRAERRREQKESQKDPVFTIRRSQLIPRMKELLGEAEFDKIIQEAVEKKELEVVAKQSEDMDALILMALNEEFKFGKSRLLRFAVRLVKLHKYYLGKYSEYEIDALKRDLKLLGVDVSEVTQMIEKELEDGTTIR